jgi:hypothetical protein
MPLVPAIPMVPEPGQTTLDFTSRYNVKRPGKPSKPETRILVRRSGARREISGESAHESILIRQFDNARIVWWDVDDSDPEGHSIHRYSYSRELKLSAVSYALNTYVRGKKPDDLPKLISCYKAAAKLKITTAMLRSWIRNRIRISNQKKGSRRSKNFLQKGKEPVMEHALFRQFEEARKIGKAVGCRWFKRYARAIYR